MDKRPVFDEGEGAEFSPAAARIAAAITLHYVTDEIELLGETLHGLSAEELASVAFHAAAIAGQVAQAVLGAENAETVLRAMVRQFVADEVQV